jgi:hypothetical protein
MNIKQKFLELTSRTYPHGTESSLFPILHSTVDGLEQDEFGNLFVMIGKSDVMFTSHLDTATSQNVSVNHVIEGDIIKTDGKSILGADDKAGVTIMLYMIQNNIPGLYYFFLGEEVGCVGSKKLSAKHKQNKIEGINKVISFDRRGTTSVISFQSSKRCASDTFTKSLADQLNRTDADFKYETDDTGVLTDSFQFVSIYPECTNISVGYQSEHTLGETQNIKHLEKLAKACLLVDWNSLPVERDPSKVDYKSYGGYYDYDGYENDYPSRNSRHYSSNNWGSITKPITENKWFHDKRWNYVSKVEYEKWTNKVVNVDLHEGRIFEEESIISGFLKSLEIEFDKIDWDGMNLKIIREGDSVATKMKKVSDRNELIEFLPELDYIKNSPNKLGGRNPLDFNYSNDYYDYYWD